MLKALPIGIDDFKELITENYYYVDKSLFIKEVLVSKAKATLIPRPRRFGKTLNMSMLKYFFEKTENPTHASLFENLAITQHCDAMAHQGQYPVIFFTLKFIDGPTWEKCFQQLKGVIGQEFRNHNYLLENSLLDARQKQDFQAIIDFTADDVTYKVSLKNLTKYLADYHHKKPIILIDEYDVPIHNGFRHGYYEEVASFVKSFFGDGIKSNVFLDFAVMTGALRVAKESIFTGLNNLEVCSFLSHLYGDKFGLLEHEVNDLIAYYNLETSREDIKSWYNGYTSGECTIYNPWSIINVAKQKGILQPYWINTSDNNIIKKLIQESGTGIKADIEALILGVPITKEIRESIIYADIESSEPVLWNFLLFSGYLTFKNRRLIDDITHADFFIPNREVAAFYKSTIREWFESKSEQSSYNQMLDSLVTGDIETFRKLFTHFIITSFSYFDISGKRPEKFYHAFVLGMLVSLVSRYHVKSNRESGYGRYDVMLIPHDKNKLGIVIEFKKTDSDDGETIEQAVANALQQIKKKKYVHEMHALGITSSVCVGIAFKGKEVLIQSR